jgi:hypothetical protein
MILMKMQQMAISAPVTFLDVFKFGEVYHQKCLRLRTAMEQKHLYVMQK